jgi:hypothetical protein
LGFEFFAMAKQTLGKLPADAFGMLELPVLPADILDAELFGKAR